MVMGMATPLFLSCRDQLAAVVATPRHLETFGDAMRRELARGRLSHGDRNRLRAFG